MFLKVNYCQDSILGKVFGIFLAGIVFLSIGEAKICSGATIDGLNGKSTFYQKLSSGKAIKYYKNIEKGINLEPLSSDYLFLDNSYIKLLEINNWALTSINNQLIPNSISPFLEIPLEVPEQYLEKPLKNSRMLYLDYAEEYLDASNIKHRDVRHSVVVLQVFIENKQLNQKWVIYAPYLYIARRIDLPIKWTPISIGYVMRRELGLPPNNIGRFSNSMNNIFFKVRLHERLDGFDAMRIKVDRSQFKDPVVNLGERLFQMRIGQKDDFNYSRKITIGATLSNYQNNLIATSYLSNNYSEIKMKEKSNVYLQELTFNFQLLTPPPNPQSFVKQIAFYKSSRDKLMANYTNNLFEPIVLKPRFIRDMGEGIGRLEVDLSNLSKELKKILLVNGAKILKADLIVDTRESGVSKVSIFKKGSLKFKKNTGVVIYKNKKLLTREEILDRLPLSIDHVKILNAHDNNITMPLLNSILPSLFPENSLFANFLLFILCFIGIFLCFIAFRNYKKLLANVIYLLTTIFSGLYARSNYFASFGLFFYFLGLLISLTASEGPFRQVYDVNFIFKDILYTFGGLILAINWKYQCFKIYMRLKNARFNALINLFKNYISSYVTGIFSVLFLCVASRQLYIPLVEIFSSLLFFLILVGTYHYVYQKTEYDHDVLTKNT